MIITIINNNNNTGRVEMLWETGQGSMMCKVKWFYHPEEIETCGRKFDLKLPVRLK